MQTSTITVQQILPPKPGGKMHKVVATDGLTYYVFSDKIANYQIGCVYDVNWQMSQFNTRNVDSATRSNQPAAAPTQQAAAVATAAAQSGTYRETSEKDKLSMFVTACVKAGIQGGQVQFNDEAISLAIQQVIAGYRAGYAAARQTAEMQRRAAAPPPPAPAPVHPDMNDSIPF